MANYATLKSAIEQVIKTNGNNEITGALLQQSLLSMINSLGAGYQFIGVAVLSPTPTNPGTPDQNVFYIAGQPGTYSNFGGLVVNDGEIAILKYNGTWTKDVTGAATEEKVTQLGRKLIKLTGYGTTGTSAGATNIGDIFYDTSTKLILKKIDSSTWETISYEDGAIYTMGGKLWIWNGTDLVELPTPDYLQVNNIQRDNAIKSSVAVGDLLYGLVPKVGYYIDSSGVETASTNTEYFTINLPAQYGYIFFRPLESGFASVTRFLVFADENGVLGYNGVQGNKGIQSTSAVGEWVCEALPSGTTKIYAMFAPGKERKVQLAALFPLYENNTKPDNTDVEIYVNDTTMNLRTYFTSIGALNRSNTLRSTVPIKVNVGDVIRVSGYSTDALGPSSTSYKLNSFDANMGFVSVANFETDPYDFTVPSGVAFVSFLVITEALASVSIKKIAVGATPKILANAVQKNSMWNGKIWAGLGDSLTAQSSSYPGLLWSPMVENATGLVFKNCGIGSTALAGNGTNAFWKRLQAVIDYNPDIVTILGGANDLYEDVPIGTNEEYSKAIASKDCNTFKGAYSYIIETLLTWKPSLRLLLLTTSYAHNDGADHTPGIGLTYKDYANATLSVAEYYGIPTVDLYRNMGINKLTQGTTYTRGDKIHWNARASQVVASLVIAKLEEINNAVPTE